MRAKKYIIYAVALLVLLSPFLYWRYMSLQQEEIVSASPVPSFLNLTRNKQVTLLDLWLPFISKIQGSEREVPTYTARSVLMFDLTTNKTLFEDNAKVKMPMASLTKIMTAIVALENKKTDDRYFVYKEALVGENSMGLTEGEELTLEELLYGLVLNSGNDATEVIAMNYSEGREAFIQAMNDKAKALGLTDTNFTNPSGLQGDGDQHTTAYDLLVITRYALDNFPLFRKIAQTYEYDIPATGKHKEYHLFNETNLITSYPGVKGVKTGYTPEAGYCLVTYLDYKGHKIIGVILGSENRRQEMKDFLDYSLNRLNLVPPEHE